MTADTESGTTAKPRKFSPWRLLPLVVIIGAIVAVFALGLDDYLSFGALRENRQALLDWRDANFTVAALTFIAIYVVVVALSLPGAVYMTIGGGFLFGTVSASIFVVVGATLGAVAIFLAARYALADLFRDKVGAGIRRMEAGFRENALSYMLVLRLVPLFPFWLVNLVPAFLGVSLRTFAIGTFFGIIPGSVVYCSVGNGVGALIERGEEPDLGIIFEPAVIGPLLGLAALSLIPVVYRRLRAGRDAASSGGAE